MCGISVVFGSDPNISEAAVQRMMGLQKHRGPDADGLLHFVMPNSHHLYLAHNRLRITDPAAHADQPFVSPCRRYVLVFNGQIYNHIALRQRLHLFNINWQTNSDTETLLYLLAYLGSQILDWLNGMFAFVFTDLHTGKILIARDRFGMKPLYFTSKNGLFLAASEAKAIVGSGLCKATLEPDQIGHYLTYKFAQRPYTLLKGIFELEPGYMFVLGGADDVCEPLFFVSNKNYIYADTDPSKFEQLLSESIQNQWPSQVHGGLMLSGGADSVLLLALLSRAGFSPDAFVAAQKNYTKPLESDLFFAQKAIDKYGGKLHIIDLDQNLPDELDNWLNNIDIPVADGAALLTYKIAKKAAEQGVKVLFSGAGADELFAGYRRHYAFIQYLKHFEGLPWKFIHEHTASLPAAKALKTQFKDLGRALSGFSENPYQTFLALTRAPYIEAELFRPDFRMSEYPDYIPSHPANSDFYMAWALEHDRNQYLCADVLAITDRASMQASIETRLPFLDNELARWAASLPTSQYLEKGQKWPIIQALLENDGRIFAKRAKKGFGSPLMQWLIEPQYRHWFDIFQDNGHSAYQVLEPVAVRALINGFLSNKNAAANETLSLILLFHWIKKMGI